MNSSISYEPKEQTAKLGKLHTKGVELRNEGVRMKGKKLPKWIKRYEKWKSQVMDVLMPLSPARAQRIRTLNRIPGKFAKPFRALGGRERRRHLMTLERRLSILEKILRKYA